MPLSRHILLSPYETTQPNLLLAERQEPHGTPREGRVASPVSLRSLGDFAQRRGLGRSRRTHAYVSHQRYRRDTTAPDWPALTVRGRRSGRRMSYGLADVVAAPSVLHSSTNRPYWPDHHRKRWRSAHAPPVCARWQSGTRRHRPGDADPIRYADSIASGARHRSADGGSHASRPDTTTCETSPTTRSAIARPSPSHADAFGPTHFRRRGWPDWMHLRATTFDAVDSKIPRVRKKPAFE